MDKTLAGKKIVERFCNRSTNTCVTTVTAVVPLQMQPIQECCLSSSSTPSNVLTYMFFQVDNNCFSSLVSLNEVQSYLSRESLSLLLEGSCSVFSVKEEDCFIGRALQTWRNNFPSKIQDFVIVKIYRVNCADQQEKGKCTCIGGASYRHSGTVKINKGYYRNAGTIQVAEFQLQQKQR